MKFVTPCALQEVNATRATAMGHARTDFANVIRTGLTMEEINVSKRVPATQFVLVTEPVSSMEIRLDVCANEDGTDPNVIFLARACWKPVYLATITEFVKLITIPIRQRANVWKSLEARTAQSNARALL